jgi:hypothetical protein
MCVTILTTFIVCRSGFFFWVLAKPLCPWKSPAMLCYLNPCPKLVQNFTHSRRLWTFDLDQSRSRGRVSHVRNIRRVRPPAPCCALCRCACAPFCRSKFCLAKTILCFCVFDCDLSGLWESEFGVCKQFENTVMKSKFIFTVFVFMCVFLYVVCFLLCLLHSKHSWKLDTCVSELLLNHNC